MPTKAKSTATNSRNPYKVFISSTYLDNKEKRRLVQDAIARAGMVWHGMEIFPASIRSPLKECLRYAKEADVLVGIIAKRYGWEPDGKKSITEMEYDAAEERLMFQLDSSLSVNPDKDFDPGVLGLLTPAYSSMQVLTGETPVPSDDVFSLACLLYRLIAGYRVFGPRNAAEAAEEGMKPQKLDALNDAQWRVLKKALSYSRVARFESMADFIDALDVEEASSVTVDIPAPQRFSEPKETRSPSGLIIGLVVVAGLGLVGANQLGYLDDLKA